MHAMLNSDVDSLVSKDSVIDKFNKETANLTPEERGNYFMQCTPLKISHQSAVQQGQCNQQDEVDTHFIAFVHKEGRLYELDGRKKTPINHGETTPATFLSDACVVAK